jgi:hypothetical protein
MARKDGRIDGGERGPYNGRLATGPIKGGPMAALSRRAFVLGCIGGCAARAGAQAVAGFPRAEAVTAGPRHHFFGYFDHCPWDGTGRHVIAHEVDFVGRQPKGGEEAVVGVIDRAAGNLFTPVARTAAWCWQLGSLARWLPSEPDRTIVYNVRRGDSWAAEARDVKAGVTRALSFPIYAINPQGTLAVSLNFSRLAWTRPGYGFEGIPDAGRHIPAPEADGVFAVDIARGTHRLIVSLADLARYRPQPAFAEAYHWVNHLLFSPDGSRFVFLHRWGQADRDRSTRLFTADPGGGGLKLLLDHAMVSHFSWRDPETIIAWARHPSAGDRFYLVNDRTGAVEVIGRDVLVQDGHVTYSPDRRFLLTDTYPDRRNLRHLMLYRVGDGARIDLGSFHSPPALTGPVRCDLHPRFSRDGAAVAIDSAHESTRQLYVLDVARWTA